MPTLPKYGWLFRCRDCDMVTSRVTVVKHRRKTKEISVCLTCRDKFINWLLEDFNSVVVKEETVGKQIVHVS